MCYLKVWKIVKQMLLSSISEWKGPCNNRVITGLSINCSNEKNNWNTELVSWFICMQLWHIIPINKLAMLPSRDVMSPSSQTFNSTCTWRSPHPCWSIITCLSTRGAKFLANITVQNVDVVNIEWPKINVDMLHLQEVNHYSSLGCAKVFWTVNNKKVKQTWCD